MLGNQTQLKCASTETKGLINLKRVSTLVSMLDEQGCIDQCLFEETALDVAENIGLDD